MDWWREGSPAGPGSSTSPEPRKPIPGPIPTRASAISGEEQQRALSEFAILESALGEAKVEDDVTKPAPHTFDMPVTEVLTLLPEKHVLPWDLVPVDAQRTVRVAVDDLFGQLARGRVSVSVARLAFDVPAHIVARSALEDEQTMVVLPLPMVVASIDPELLREHRASEVRRYDVDALPDPFPFTRGEDGAPHLISEPQPTRDPEPTLPGTVLPGAAPDPPPGSPWMETECSGGVDLNLALYEELLVLDGVSPAMARRILAYRLSHGGIRDIFELRRIDRVGRKTFKRITGMPYSRRGRHRGAKLMRLLGLPRDRASHLPSIAAALAAQPGFVACVISDRDGLLLAAGGADGFADALSATLPKMLQQLEQNVSEFSANVVESVSLRLGGRLFTVVSAGEVVLTAVHKVSRLTQGEYRLVSRVAEELRWLLSHRGYVGAIHSDINGQARA